MTYFDHENVAIAVDTEKGLLTPVIKNAGDLNVAGLARKIADVAERTRANKIGPDELSGGTFTLTNTGSRGALFDTPIINQPQVAILGTGTVVKRPVVIDDPNLGETIAVRQMVYLALTYDHRLVDGADAARFLSDVKAAPRVRLASRSDRKDPVAEFLIRPAASRMRSSSPAPPASSAVVGAPPQGHQVVTAGPARPARARTSPAGTRTPARSTTALVESADVVANLAGAPLVHCAVERVLPADLPREPRRHHPHAGRGGGAHATRARRSSPRTASPGTATAAAR